MVKKPFHCHNCNFTAKTEREMRIHFGESLPSKEKRHQKDKGITVRTDCAKGKPGDVKWTSAELLQPSKFDNIIAWRARSAATEAARAADRAVAAATESTSTSTLTSTPGRQFVKYANSGHSRQSGRSRQTGCSRSRSRSPRSRSRTRGQSGRNQTEW